MSAYTPVDFRTIGMLLPGFAFVLAAGLAISRIRRRRLARIAAWLLVFSSVLFAERLAAAEPAGVRMLAIIGILLWAMKAVVSVEGDGSPLTPVRWLCFAAAWPGMRPSLFERAGAPALEGAGRLVVTGIVRLLAGAGLIGAAWLVWNQSRSRLAATALLLPGLSLVLHFGIFNLLAGGWRYLGVDAGPLFKAPLYSRSLTEFWGRRWNLAFSEMTATGIYRPVSSLAGRPAGIFAAFLASGILHETAISLPVKTGFGLPLLYFALHGGLMLTEKALEKGGRAVSRSKAFGRAWVIFWLVSPLPVLFHVPFLNGVVWPIIGMQR
ncbi:MAG: hypothetical protein FD180_2532 [Planctomycetota bacterium]|nr:MAG: hypothetical protein FD180_2532 [Planctomycetota bacterium]